jgi:hypothetical protein
MRRHILAACDVVLNRQSLLETVETTGRDH